MVKLKQMKIIKIGPHMVEIEEMIKIYENTQNIAERIGIEDITQPGLIKEIIMAKELGHDLIPGKRNPDACNQNDNSIFYEYLTCQESKKTFAFDDMKSRPAEAMAKSLNKIRRNDKIYFGVFSNGIILKEIYEVNSDVILKQTEDDLNRRNNIIKKNRKEPNSEHTITYPLEYIKKIGTLVIKK